MQRKSKAILFIVWTAVVSLSLLAAVPNLSEKATAQTLRNMVKSPEINRLLSYYWWYNYQATTPDQYYYNNYYNYYSLPNQTPLNANQYYNYPTITNQNAYRDNLGRVHIVGQVTNYSPFTVQYVQVIASIYDANNNLIRTHPTVTHPEDILAGQQALFDLILSPTDLPLGQANHYALVVNWS